MLDESEVSSIPNADRTAAMEADDKRREEQSRANARTEEPRQLPPVQEAEVVEERVDADTGTDFRETRIHFGKNRGLSLDEASILRGFGGSKTFREFMKLFTGDAGPMGNRRGIAQVPYRFVATATPSPNEYIELLAYADFLGIMDVSQLHLRREGPALHFPPVAPAPDLVV